MSNLLQKLFIIAAVTLIELAHGQRMFAEYWFMKHETYDVEGSTCRINADCDAAGKRKVDANGNKIEQSCALIEIYVATSISISEFVEPTRSM